MSYEYISLMISTLYSSNGKKTSVVYVTDSDGSRQSNVFKSPVMIVQSSTDVIGHSQSSRQDENTPTAAATDTTNSYVVSTLIDGLTLDTKDAVDEKNIDNENENVNDKDDDSNTSRDVTPSAASAGSAGNAGSATSESLSTPVAAENEILFKQRKKLPIAIALIVPKNTSNLLLVEADQDGKNIGNKRKTHKSRRLTSIHLIYLVKFLYIVFLINLWIKNKHF